MLIKIQALHQKYNLQIQGILHIGAHECEELQDYVSIGIPKDKIIWLEGNQKIVEKMKARDSSLRIYQEIISHADGQDYNFIITNNGQSSSILELDEHKKEHPQVIEVDRYPVKSICVDTFFKKYQIDPSSYNFVNIDIQGAELYALQGMTNYIQYVDYFYLEVNQKHLYKNCPLMSEIDQFLFLYGFNRVETSMTKHGWGDAFYIKTASDK